MKEPFSVDSARTRDLDETTRAAIVRVCIAAHNEPDFQRLFLLLPPDGLHVLAYAGDEPVSHAVVTTRWLQPHGLPLLRTAYVDAVSTDPTVQGQGYGSAVMRRLAVLSSDEYEIACLETDRVGFYTRLGWEAWRGPLAGRAEHILIPTPEQTGVMVLRLPRTPELDLDTLLTIEAQTGRIW